MSTVGEVVAVFTANTVDFDRGVAGVQAKTAELGASTSNMARVGALAWGALGAAAIGFGAIAVKQAQEQEVATARLKTAIGNVGQSYADYAGQIGKAESAGIKLGYADDEITAGLGKLVPATKDVHRSITDMALAEDIARGRHIDLSAATDLLVKVETGHVALLGRIGINTKDATGATISQEEAIKRLTDMYGGQAAAYTQTFAGRIAVLKAQFGELAEKVGFVLIPVLENLMTGISDTVGFFERNRAAAYALATIIGGPLVYAMGAFVAVKIGAFVESLVTSFVTLRAAVAATVEAIVADAGLMAIGMLGPLGLIAGALSFMVLGDGPYEKAKAAASDWATKTAAAARATGDEYATLKGKQESLGSRVDALKEKQRALTEAITMGGQASQENQHASQALAEQILVLQSRHDALTPRIKELKQQQIEAAAIERQRVADVTAVANGTTTLANATDMAKKAIQDYQSVVLATSNTELGRQQAVLNVAKAQQDYNAAVDQYGPASQQAQEASLNLQSAQLQVVSSTLSAADATDAFNAATSKNPALIQATIAKLEEQIKTHGDASGAVQAYIDKLHGMQFTIDGLHGTHITVTADTAGAINAIIGVQSAIEGITRSVVVDITNVFHDKKAAHGGVAAMARGGWVTAGPQFALIGEDGPEAVLPFTKYDDMVATIANTGQAPRIARAAAQAAGQLASNSGLNGLTGSFNIDQAAGPGSTSDAMKTLILSQVGTATKLALNNFWQAQDDAQRASDAALYTTLSTFMQSASVTADSVRQLMQSVLDDFWSTTDEAQRANDAALFQTLNTQLRTLSGSGYSQPGSPDGTGVISGNGTVTNGNGTVTGTVKLDSSDLKDIITQLIAVLGRVVTSEDGLSQSEGDLALMIGQLNSTLGIGYSPSGGFLTTRG